MPQARAKTNEEQKKPEEKRREKGILGIGSALTGSATFFFFSLFQTSHVAHNLHFFYFLGLYLWHMETARLGVRSGLQMLAYATATL